MHFQRFRRGSDDKCTRMLKNLDGMVCLRTTHRFFVVWGVGGVEIYCSRMVIRSLDGGFELMAFHLHTFCDEQGLRIVLQKKGVSYTGLPYFIDVQKNSECATTAEQGRQSRFRKHRIQTGRSASAAQQNERRRVDREQQRFRADTKLAMILRDEKTKL